MIEELLKENPYFTAGFGLIGVGAGLAIIKQGLVQGLYHLKRSLLVSLEIPSKDKSYHWFLHWLSTQNMIASRKLAVETNFKLHSNGSASTQFTLVPGPGKHYFKWNGVWIQIERQRETKTMDFTSGSPWETVTLTTLSRDRDLFPNMLEEARKLALKKVEGKTVLYTAFAADWRQFGLPRKRKTIDSVVLKEGQRDRICKDVIDFLNNSDWYFQRGIPYRRGYLLYGPPGTGKSSFIQALAGYIEYNICILNLAERGLSDDRLNHLLAGVPERSIILLEDIDAIFSSRSQTDEHGYQSNVTFSGLLNALDGVSASEERLIFMTTNHFDKLDPAIIRPGRVDMKECLDNVDEYQAYNLFLRFYNDSRLATEFSNALNGSDISPAVIQGWFIANKNYPKNVIALANQHLHRTQTKNTIN